MADDVNAMAGTRPSRSYPWPDTRAKRWPAPSVADLLETARDSYSATALADVIDRSLHANAAQFTGGLSPLGLWLAYLDWASHLAVAPGKQAQLRTKAVRKALRYLTWLDRAARQQDDCSASIEPLPQDNRFRSAGWQAWPFNAISQAFLLTQQWWHNATSGVRGVDAQNEAITTFATRQLLDVFSPSNIP